MILVNTTAWATLASSKPTNNLARIESAKILMMKPKIN